MVETEYNFRSGVYKVKTFGTTHRVERMKRDAIWTAIVLA